MAQGLNKVMLIGHLGADPELRYTAGATAVMRLRLATTRTYLDTNKVRQERTEWHTITVWGARAEGLAKILSKGKQLYVEGEIRTSTYEDREGVKRYRTEIVSRDIVLCGGGSRGGTRGAPPAADRGEDGHGDATPDDYGPPPDDDDIPF